MTKNPHTKYIHEGSYAAKVDVDLIENEEGWAPYISVEDSFKLDDIRNALKKGDIQKASQLGRIFKLTPIDV